MKYLLPVLFFMLSGKMGFSQDIEFRGVWIASVEHIDWPQKGRISEAELKADFLDLLDYYEDLNYNAAIVQIRTAGDALYPSKLAPWSKYLSGKQGKAPDFEGDILKWMIAQCHGRNMEFHAWLNPYRASTSLDKKQFSPTHVYSKYPDWIIPYGDRLYMDPGLPKVRQHLLDVVEEIVVNYDIDAIHFDDYFYPYKIEGKAFNDAKSYTLRTNKSLSLANWRRENVNLFVQECSALIKRINPEVEFGISPFGVWRNNSVDPSGSATSAGQTNYDDLYADVLLWCNKGWLDYVAPQLYFSMDYEPASFKVLTNWWINNHGTADLYLGLGMYKVLNNHDKAWDDLEEIPRQLNYIRNQPEVNGHILFSAKSLRKLPVPLYSNLVNNYYQNPALVKTPSPNPIPLETLKPTPKSEQTSTELSPTVLPVEKELTVALKKGPEQFTLSIEHIPADWEQLIIQYFEKGGLFKKAKNHILTINNPSSEKIELLFPRKTSSLLVTLKKGSEQSVVFDKSDLK